MFILIFLSRKIKIKIFLTELELKTHLKATFLFGVIYFAFDHCPLEILCVT